MTTWVIGRGGLLGHAIATRASDVVPSDPVPWHDLNEARSALQHHYRVFRHVAGESAWTVVWAAGSAVISGTPQEMELSLLEEVLQCLRRDPPPGPGVFFLASSAGGVYAGSSGSPFNSDAIPNPISAYGRLKLQEEAATIEVLQGVAPVVIGRFANLYGPRQNRNKSQGLVTRLCLACIYRDPVSIFVPLQTQRDWIAVDDAARVALQLCNQARGGAAVATVQVIGTGIPTTVGRLIRIVEEVTHRTVPVTYGMDASAIHQPFDLRLQPGPAVIQALGTATPLPSGVRHLYDYLSVRG